MQRRWYTCCAEHGLAAPHAYHAEWFSGFVTQLVLAIVSKDTRLPLERWVFNINLVELPVDSAEPYVYCMRACLNTTVPQTTPQAGIRDLGRDSLHPKIDCSLR